MIPEPQSDPNQIFKIHSASLPKIIFEYHPAVKKVYAVIFQEDVSGYLAKKPLLQSLASYQPAGLSLSPKISSRMIKPPGSPGPL